MPHEEEPPPLERWVTDFTRNQQYIRNLLDEILRTRLHNPAKAREKMRNFSERDAFQAIYYSYNGDEPFLTM